MLQRLGQVLSRCAARGHCGVVSVAGEPGGTIHLSGGGVTAIDTPGAPGPEVILLRSGRVPEPAWAAAFSAAAAGPMGAELVRRGLVGAGDLAALLRAALADAMFALASGGLADCVPAGAPADCLLPLAPPADPGWLVAATSRRLAAAAALPALPAPAGHARDRWAAAPGAAVAGGRGGGRDAILALANGRRTIRDLAFALGRGVFAVTLEVALMRAEGLLVPAARPDTPAGAPAAAAPVAARPRPPREPAGEAADGAGAGPLPRRRPGQGLPRRDRPAAGPADRAALLWPRRPGGPGGLGTSGPAD